MSVMVTHYVMPDRSGHKIIITTVWYFFLLLNTYYGGALTMFFTSHIRIPFNNMRDVIQAHPDWKLVFLKGYEATFALNAERDPVYANYWARVQENIEEYKFKTIKEGLGMIAKSEIVIRIDDFTLRGYTLRQIRIMCRGLMFLPQ
jgi:hypothetical protein